MFYTLIFFCLLHLVGVFASDTDEVNIVLAMEGDSVTLHTNVTETHRHQIPCVQLWLGPEDTRLVRVVWINEEKCMIRYYENEVFGDRLEMDNQTGSLTIRNIRTTDSGLYQMQIKSFKELFSVTVYDSVHCCGFTEAVIRLVISAVVGVAIVAIVVYDIRSRRAEKKQRTSQSIADDEP